MQMREGSARVTRDAAGDQPCRDFETNPVGNIPVAHGVGVQSMRGNAGMAGRLKAVSQRRPGFKLGSG